MSTGITTQGGTDRLDRIWILYYSSSSEFAPVPMAQTQIDYGADSISPQLFPTSIVVGPGRRKDYEFICRFEHTYDGTGDDPNPFCLVTGTVNGNNIFAQTYFRFLMAASAADQMQAALTPVMSDQPTCQMGMRRH
jgi:hypothetical protein